MLQRAAFRERVRRPVLQAAPRLNDLVGRSFT
jgi:hypothetical protein